MFFTPCSFKESSSILPDAHSGPRQARRGRDTCSLDCPARRVGCILNHQGAASKPTRPLVRTTRPRSVLQEVNRFKAPSSPFAEARSVSGRPTCLFQRPRSAPHLTMVLLLAQAACAIDSTSRLPPRCPNCSPRPLRPKIFARTTPKTDVLHLHRKALHWKTKEGLVRRSCSCRGTAGFVARVVPRRTGEDFDGRG